MNHEKKEGKVRRFLHNWAKYSRESKWFKRANLLLHGAVGFLAGSVIFVAFFTLATKGLRSYVTLGCVSNYCIYPIYSTSMIVFMSLLAYLTYRDGWKGILETLMLASVFDASSSLIFWADPSANALRFWIIMIAVGLFFAKPRAVSWKLSSALVGSYILMFLYITPFTRGILLPTFQTILLEACLEAYGAMVFIASFRPKAPKEITGGKPA